MWTLLHIAFGVIGVIFVKRFHGTVLSPVGVMIVCWLGGLSVAQSGIIKYDSIPPPMVGLYYGSLISFIAGGALVYRRPRPTRLQTRKVHASAVIVSGPRPAAPVLSNEYVATLLICSIIFSAAGIIGGVIYYRYINQVFGLSTLILNPSEIRYEESYGFLRRLDGSISGWVILKTMLVPTSIPSIAYLQIPKAKHKGFIGLLLSLVFGFIILNTGRTAMFSAAVMSVATALHFRQSLGLPVYSLRKRIVVCISVSLALGLYFAVTSSALGKDASGVDLGANFALPDRFESLFTPIYYFTCSFVAFPKMFYDLAPYADNGNLTFGFMATILNRIAPGAAQYPEYIQPFCAVPLPTNIYTYLDAPLIDFGPVGIVPVTFLYGACAMAIFRWWGGSRSIIALYVLSICIYCCASSIIVNRFGNFETALWVGIGAIIISLSKIFAKFYTHAIRGN